MLSLALFFALGTFLLALAVLVAMDATFQITFNQGQDVLTNEVTVTADSKDYSEIAVAAGATINFTIGMDPDNVAGYLILPDFTGTLTTTNSTGSADVVTLTANVGLGWHSQMGLTDSRFVNRNPWTSWALHNTGATDGTFKVLIMRDGTP